MATGVMFGLFGANILGGTGATAYDLDWETDTSKAQLHTSAASFDVDADGLVADVTNQVANGNGYTTGGATLANPVLTYNATGNKTVADADDPTWTASGAGFAASHAVFVGDTAGDGLLIEYLAFDAGTITLAAADTLTINLDATNGVYYVTAT